MQLSWCGGRLPRPDLPQGGFSPFSSNQVASDSQQAAALKHFTEPGLMQQWMQCATVAPSKLSTTHAPLPAIREQTEREDRTRGNRVVVHQHMRPERMSAQQWGLFASLRAYPLQQVSRLCAVLHSGALTEFLDMAEVRSCLAVNGFKN
jgi:hypothetical protein